MTTDDTALSDLLLRLGCNTWALGVRYAAWSQRAPAPEAAVTPALLARHELAHARAWQAVLARRGTTLALDERAPRHTVPFLRHPFATWADLLAANLLFDTTIGILLLAAWDSTDRAMRHQARRMTPDLSLHLNHALSWARRLGGEGGPSARALEAALLRMWDDALCWPGAPDDPGMLTLAARGALDATPEILAGARVAPDHAGGIRRRPRAAGASRRHRRCVAIGAPTAVGAMGRAPVGIEREP